MIERIESVQALGPRRFEREFIRARRPVVLTRQMEGWGALHWTPQGLKQRTPSPLLQFQEGNMEQEETRLGHVDFHDYLDEITAPERDPQSIQKRYVAQFELLETFPQLRADLRFAELLPPRRLLYCFGWVGPSGTVTGLHKDDSNNFLAQLYGSKQVVLFSPADEPYLYPSRKYDYGARLSQVDLEAHDATRHPLFTRARREELILQPGEMLLIPVGWWHHVRSLSASISVSCFFQSYLEYALTAPESVRWALHQLRLLGWREGCTCHSHRNVRGA